MRDTLTTNRTQPHRSDAVKMAGESDQLVTSVLLRMLLLAATMATVETKCTFTGEPLIAKQRLDLVCNCPKGEADFKILESLGIDKVTHRETIRFYPLKAGTKNVQVIAEELTHKDNSEGRMRLHLRLLNVTQKDEATFTCIITGRADSFSRLDTTRVNYTFRLNEVLPKTTTTTTTTTPLNALAESTALTTNKDETHQAARTVDEEDEVSRTNLYIAVAVSCVLVVVVVFVIICFVRVRVTRRRERTSLEENPDFELGLSHTANQNLIYKPSVACNGHRHHHHNNDDVICDHGACNTCTSSGRLVPGHSSAGQTHSSRSPREKLQVHKKRKVDRGGRAENGGPNLLPLLSDQNVAHGGNGRRGRETTSSEDEEDTEWRRQTLLLDTPRRPRPLGYAQFATPDGYPVAPPTASRSYAALDCTVPCNAGYLRSHHRHPFPRHGYDDCSDEDFAAPASRRYGHDKHGHPRRSFSQDSVRRPSRHRHHCATQSPLLDRNYFPPGPSTNPRRPSFARLPSDCEDDGFQATPLVPPIGLRQRVHDDDSSQEGTSPAPFRDRGKAERPRPAAVRVREDCNLMYSDCFQRPSEDDGDSATGEDVMYRPYEAGNVADAAGLAEMGPQCFSQSHPRRTSEEEPSRGGPQCGGASGSRNVNQQRSLQERRYPIQGLPLRRHRHHTSPTPRHHYDTSPPPYHHYNTAPSPRHKYNTTFMRHNRSAERALRQGRSIQHNRSHPQPLCLSDSETEGTYTLQQYADERPSRRRRRGRSLSRSADDALDDSDADFPRLSLQQERNERSRQRMEGVITSAPRANQELPRPPSPIGSEAERQLNLLSRENRVAFSGRGLTTPLNVPVRDQNVPSSSSVPGDPRQGEQKQVSAVEHRPPGRREDGRTQRVLGEDGRPGPSGYKKTTPAAKSDSSPDTPSRRRGNRRPSLTSSDSNNGSAAGAAAPFRRRHEYASREADGEINLRDIKTDNEMRCKRPVSVRSRSDRPPVACAADMADSPKGGGAWPVRRGAGLQKKDSVSSNASRPGRGGSRREAGREPEVVRSGSGRWEQLGVDILTSVEQSANGKYSLYTEHDHSTSVKTAYHRLE